MNDSVYATTAFFGAQISSALAYLESLHIYHRDVAARNCLVTLDLTIKLQDLAMCNEIYTDDYVLVPVGNDIQTRRPVRWSAWETICLVSPTARLQTSPRVLFRLFRIDSARNPMSSRSACFSGRF